MRQLVVVEWGDETIGPTEPLSQLGGQALLVFDTSRRILSATIATQADW